MQGDEIRALRRLQREQGPSSHVFRTERDGPMTPKAFHALFGRIDHRCQGPPEKKTRGFCARFASKTPFSHRACPS